MVALSESRPLKSAMEVGKPVKRLVVEPGASLQRASPQQSAPGVMRPEIWETRQQLSRA